MSSTTHAIAIQAVIRITIGSCFQAIRNRLIALAKLQDIQVSGVRLLNIFCGDGASAPDRLAMTAQRHSLYPIVFWSPSIA